jgi:hypothetical protein
MSDTRAAIRELRSLSEKRSLNALSEAETARWVALRRQLGLPLEEFAPPPPVPVPLSRPSPAPRTLTPPPEAAPQPLAGKPPSPEANGTPPASEAASPSQSVAIPETQPGDAGTEVPWNGPALDMPVAPGAAAWVGPAIDAPAWLDATADRPTDPGLDGPPPIPFDEAPAAARPHDDSPAGDFGGSPEERHPLATASDFVSYAREGDESIELPTEGGPSEELESQSLAQLASAHASGFAPETAPAPGHSNGPLADAQKAALDDVGGFEQSPELEASVPAALERDTGDGVSPGTPFQYTSDILPTPSGVASQEGAYELSSAEVPSGDEGVLAENTPLDAAVPEALGGDEAPASEMPLQLETLLPAALGGEEGARAEAPAEGSPLDVLGLEEGVVPEPPLPEETYSPVMLGTEEGALAEAPAPLQLGTPLLETSRMQTAASVDLGLDEGAVEPLPPAVSTWAPGADEPPLLATDDFAPTGEALGGQGLDPWPETVEGTLPPEEAVFAEETVAPEVAVAPEEAVETVDDADLVEDGATPTPLPPLPVVTQSGSGGIRGFQFPKPPPGPVSVPVPPTPPAWQRTQPGVPPFSTSAPREVPLPPTAVAPTTPPPSPPSPPRPRPLSGTGFTAVPVPPQPPAPMRPAAVAPTTPPPSPPAPPPPRAAMSIPVGRVTPPASPWTMTPAAVPVRETPAAHAARPMAAPAAVRTPVPSAARPPPPPAPTPVVLEDEEAHQPLLDLVDEVEPPRAVAAPRRQPTPSPPRGTPAVFGPPMMLNPSIIEGSHRVVVHTLEGQVHRGTVKDLDLQDEALIVQQPDGRSVSVPTQRVKAVFFVLSPGDKPLATKGERVQVTFRDGRQVVGYSEDHATGDAGFFVVPSDARTNTARVYVFRAGVQSVTAG